MKRYKDQTIMLDSQKERLAIEQTRWLLAKKKRQAKRYLEFREVIKIKRDRWIERELARQAKQKENTEQLLWQDKTLTQIADELRLSRQAVITLLRDATKAVK